MIVGQGFSYAVLGIASTKKRAYPSEMIKYIGFGFIASALGSLYMFFRAISNGFSSEVGLCLTRGGESCFATSNPVWTASTLKWLAPVILLVSIIGFLGIGMIGQNVAKFVFAIVVVISIMALALNNEIKDKSSWMSPVLKTLHLNLFGS